MKVVMVVVVLLKVYSIKKRTVIMVCPLEGLKPIMVCQSDL
jgi:hypothetical protein